MSAEADWMEVNDKFLAATVEWIRLRLQQVVAPPVPDVIDEKLALARQEMIKLEHNDPPPALILLADHLSLTEFDCHTLALCAAVELDTRIAGLCAKAQCDLNKPYPTFALAFALFDDPDWNALSPHSGLRHWRLLEINQPGTQALTSASLCADERIVNYLKGLNYLDDRLTPLLDPIQLDSMGMQHIAQPLPPSQQQLVDTIIKHLKYSNGMERAPVIELLGHDSDSKRLVAGRVASALGLNLYRIDIKVLPSQTGDFETFSRLWQRESLLMPLALYFDTGRTADLEKTQLKRFLERSGGVVFLDLEDATAETARKRFCVDVNKPIPEEQEQLWTEVLQGPQSDQPQRIAEHPYGDMNYRMQTIFHFAYLQEYLFFLS